MTHQKTIKITDLIVPKLLPVFNDTTNSHIIVTSGRAGTKSSGFSIRDAFKVLSDDNCSIVVMRKFHNKLKKTVYKEYLRAFQRLGVDKGDKSQFKITVSPMEIKYQKNGNVIYFTGNDSIDDTKGMIDENKPIKRVLVDETTEFFDKGDGENELANIEATFVRGNDEEFQMIYLFNPPKNPKAPIMKWLEKMKLREDTIHIHLDYRDVPEAWLGKKLIESAEQMKKVDEEMYNWLWLGLCTGLQDLIYYMFDEDVHVKDLRHEELIRVKNLSIGIDYGQMNATTFECFGMLENTVRGIDEYYHSGRETGHQKSPSDYAKDFKQFVEKIEKRTKSKVLFCFIDPSAKGLKEELKRVVPNIKFRETDNTVALGISRVQKLLAYKKLILSSSQVHLREEMSLYKYDDKSIERGKEVPIKEDDHCQDATRYNAMGMWKRYKYLLPATEREDTNSE